MTPFFFLVMQISTEYYIFLSSIEFLCVPNLLENSKSFCKMSAGTLSLSLSFYCPMFGCLEKAENMKYAILHFWFCNFFFMGKKCLGADSSKINNHSKVS